MIRRFTAASSASSRLGVGEAARGGGGEIWRAAASSSSSSTHPPIDVLISGGGIVGQAAAAAIQLLNTNARRTQQQHDVHAHPDSTNAHTHQHPPLLSATLVDATATPPVFEPHTNLFHTLRTVALSRASGRILDRLDAWDGLTTKHPYHRMAIRHEAANGPPTFTGDSTGTGSGSSTSSTFFLNSLVGQPNTAPLIDFTDLERPLGFICYNAEVQGSLADALESSDNNNSSRSSSSSNNNDGSVSVRYGAEAHVQPTPPSSSSTSEDSGPLSRVQIKTRTSPGSAAAANEAGETISARLVVGSEGRSSTLASSVIASPTIERGYAQWALVASVLLEFVDDGNVCCFQNFLLDGSIIGFLPTGPNTANLVYSVSSHKVKGLQALPNEELVAHFNSILHAFAPSDIPLIVGLITSETLAGSTPTTTTTTPGSTPPTGPPPQRAVGAFPLRLSIATVPYTRRALLIGDAAHGIHPMAGQGLNLGLYDVAALTDALHHALLVGADVGSATHVGARVASAMLVHSAPVIGVMEAIKATTSATPALSTIGMRALDYIGPGKRALAACAGGDHLATLRPDSLLL